jgi:hypothetical protein
VHALLPALARPADQPAGTPALTQQLADFEFLRSMFPQKDLELVKFQIYSLIKKNNKNCGWDPEEDALLNSLV